jgi:protein dithiol oxidoreductase (disulfide-forming)
MLKYLNVGLLIACCAVVHAEGDFAPGRHYDLITPAQPTRTGDKIEVLELFWYGCPHCYTFEPHIKKWLAAKADYIEFVRMPAVFAENWLIHARAYYAAEQLGVLDTIHTPLFEAIHVKKRKLFTEDALATFFAEFGTPEEAFRQAYHTFDVDTKTRQAVAATRSYGITGVPAVIVNGKYRSSARNVGGYDELLKLVDHLAAKEHAR